MKIDISADNESADADLEHFVRSRVNFAFGNRKGRVARVAVQLSALEAGEKADKYCQVRVTLTRQPDLAVEVIDSNIYVAIHRAVDRAGWEVSRRLTREYRDTGVSRVNGKLALKPDESEQAA